LQVNKRENAYRAQVSRWSRTEVAPSSIGAYRHGWPTRGGRQWRPERFPCKQTKSPAVVGCAHEIRLEPERAEVVDRGATL
jgi:hypothetical protein